MVAVFGAHDMNNAYESERYQLSPKEIYIHDDWNPRTSDYDADVSLLEFETGSIHFNDFVQPICLWDSENESPVIDGVAASWGKMEDATIPNKNLPKLVKTLIQTNEDCFLDKDKLLDLSSKRYFCAGLSNGSEICSGDSGGGLFIKVDDVFHLKGIVLSSPLKDGGCSVSKNAIYTNVLKFRDWVRTVTGVPGEIRSVHSFASTNSEMPFKRLRRSADQCGRSEMTVGLVVGGQKFRRGDFPWIVALFFRENDTSHQYFCGGTLISSLFVISGKY